MDDIVEPDVDHEVVAYGHHWVRTPTGEWDARDYYNADPNEWVTRDESARANWSFVSKGIGDEDVDCAYCASEEASRQQAIAIAESAKFKPCTSLLRGRYCMLEKGHEPAQAHAYPRLWDE